MTVTIDIAGTSAGGSSYATRILKALADNPTGSTIVLAIGKGPKQSIVYNYVKEAAKLIELAASKLSNTECSFNFQIIKA